MTIKEEEALNQWLDKQLKARLIVESKSRYIVPCFYISKKDRLLWLVQDYRKLNQVTIKNKTPLPLIREVINKLKEANTSTSWISFGDITIYRSRKGRQLFWQTKAYLNLKSCILDCAICQELFKGWWTTSFENYCMKKYWPTTWTTL